MLILAIGLLFSPIFGHLLLRRFFGLLFGKIWATFWFNHLVTLSVKQRIGVIGYNHYFKWTNFETSLRRIRRVWRVLLPQRLVTLHPDNHDDMIFGLSFFRQNNFLPSRSSFMTRNRFSSYSIGFRVDSRQLHEQFEDVQRSRGELETHRVPQRRRRDHCRQFGRNSENFDFWWMTSQLWTK